MCYPKPGPRCSGHAEKKLSKKTEALMEIYRKEDKSKLDKALTEFKSARDEYDSTPKGQKDLEYKIREMNTIIGIKEEKGADIPVDLTNARESYTERKAEGQAKRKRDLEAYKTARA